MTLSRVRKLNVQLEQLEDMRGDVGPQLRPEQVQGLVTQAFRAARGMRDRMRSLSKRETRQFDRLRINLNAALSRESQYRAEQAHAEIAPQGRPLSEEDQALFEAKLKALRLNSKVCPDSRRRADITVRDRREMEYVCRQYPDYVRELLQNEQLLIKFFKWGLRSCANVDVFVQFPKMAEKLMKCHADKRFGAVFGYKRDDPGLRVRDGKVEMKVYGGIEGTGCVRRSAYVPINNPKLRVALTNLVDETAPPYIVTVGEIFRQLRAKNRGYENVEVLSVGLSNWNTIQCGSYNPSMKGIHRMDPMRWMEDTPPVAIVTQAEIEARFRNPKQHVTEGGVKFCISISRQFADTKNGPRVDNCHAFITVFIPEKDGRGRYRELNLGLQPDFLPKNILQKLWLIGATELAKVHVIDESRYLIGDMVEGGFREHRGILYNLNSDEAKALNKFVAAEIKKGHDGKKIFSPQGNNCANWVQKAFWKLFVDPLLFQPLRELFAGHRNQNLPAYLRAIERATKASNDDALEFHVKRVIQNLNQEQTVAVIRGCYALLDRTLFKQHHDSFHQPNFERLQRVDFRKLRQAAQDLLIETLKSTQFFRMRIREADASFGPFNWINQGLNRLRRKRIVSEGFVNACYKIINFVFFGSWRFTVFSTEKGVRFKSLFTSKYHQAGTIPLPVGLKRWVSQEPRKRGDLSVRMHKIRALQGGRRYSVG